VNPSAPDPNVVERVAAALRGASSVLFVTGAGISAESGLPTYRGIGGLYDASATDDGIRIEEALSGHMLRIRPEIAWKHIHQIESACRGASWNRAHEIVAAFERKLRRAWVLTQNVDGFHREAGSKNLIEIHGNVHDLSCTRCAWRTRVSSYADLAIPPSCPTCGALVRPDVVLFGEMLPSNAVATLERELRHGFDVVFSIGTTSVFPYIAGPVLMARRLGDVTVEINPGETEVSHLVQHRLRTGAVAALEAIWSRL
jgi:NAD-dependent deacetylase